MICVASIGPGSPDYLTQACLEALTSGKKIVFRTSQHPVADWLEKKHVPFTSFDAMYETADDFDALYEQMAEALMEKSRKEDIVYAVPDPGCDVSVQKLVSKAADMTILPGVSLSSFYLSQLPAGSSAATSLLTYAACDFSLPYPDAPCLITEIFTRSLASDLKLVLSDCYPETSPVVFFSTEHDRCRTEQIPLYELDRQKQYDHLTALYLPALPFEARERFSFHDLMHIMRVLRSPDGCPWDRVQTHASLRPYLLEEAYEAAGAIDEEDMDHLADELGDVMLQVVFHAAIAEAAGDFNATDIATSICKKMMRRHPQIFGGAKDAVSWEELKKEERRYATVSDSLRDVSRALPALTRASKIFSRSGALSEPLDAWFREIINGTGMEDGDILLACVRSVCRNQPDPEAFLHRCIERLIGQYEWMEKQILSDGKSAESLTSQELHVYWQMVMKKMHD